MLHTEFPQTLNDLDNELRARDEWTGELILSPTNVAFYGDDLDRLALASLCGHNVVTIATGRAGAPIRLPRMESHD